MRRLDSIRNGLRRQALILVASALVAPAGIAGDQARHWLDEMNRAFNELNYEGIFSYYSGQDLASLHVIHMVVDGEQRERLVHLNGAPREIFRQGESVACILMPGDTLQDLEQSIPSGPFTRAFVRRYDRISDYYGLAFVGEDRVADRPATRLAVTPRDTDRYGFRLWLDQETRMLLRSELVDQRGARLEIFQFNQIRFGDDVRAEGLQATEKQDGSMVTHLTLATKTPEPADDVAIVWRPAWLPDGFNMAATDIRRASGSDSTVSTMMYSDGLAAFSLFVENMPESGATPMISRSGATVAVTGAVSDLAGEQYLVTLVGEVPTATAQRVVGSVGVHPEP